MKRYIKHKHMKKYTLGNTVSREDIVFYTEIYVDHCNNEPKKLYAEIFADTKSESIGRAIAIMNILQLSQSL